MLGDIGAQDAPPPASLAGATSVNSSIAHCQLGVIQSIRSTIERFEVGRKEKPGHFSLQLQLSEEHAAVRGFCDFLAVSLSCGLLAFSTPYETGLRGTFHIPPGRNSHYVNEVERACRGGDYANIEMGRDTEIGDPVGKTNQLPFLCLDYPIPCNCHQRKGIIPPPNM